MKEGEEDSSSELKGQPRSPRASEASRSNAARWSPSQRQIQVRTKIAVETRGKPKGTNRVVIGEPPDRSSLNREGIKVAHDHRLGEGEAAGQALTQRVVSRLISKLSLLGERPQCAFFCTLSMPAFTWALMGSAAAAVTLVESTRTSSAWAVSALNCFCQ
jgi:hypothetical protein